MENLEAIVATMLDEYFTDNVTVAVKNVLARRAVLAFREYLKYPKSMTEGDILADMNAHVSCITDLALYEAIQMGAEFQSMHIESGLYRMWVSKGSVYTQHGVVPYATT